MAYELTYRPLEYGSNESYLRRSLEDPSLLIPEKEIGCFLVLQSSYALHETIGLSAQNLDISWQSNQNYLSSNCDGEAPLAWLEMMKMKGLFTSARHHRRAHDFLQATAQLLSYTILNMKICQNVYICAALFF